MTSFHCAYILSLFSGEEISDKNHNRTTYFSLREGKRSGISCNETSFRTSSSFLFPYNLPT